MKAKKTQEENKRTHNEYNKKWAKENPDKVAAQRERYWTKKAEALDLERARA